MTFNSSTYSPVSGFFSPSHCLLASASQTKGWAGKAPSTLHHNTRLKMCLRKFSFVAVCLLFVYFILQGDGVRKELNNGQERKPEFNINCREKDTNNVEGNISYMYITTVSDSARIRAPNSSPLKGTKRGVETDSGYLYLQNVCYNEERGKNGGYWERKGKEWRLVGKKGESMEDSGKEYT